MPNHQIEPQLRLAVAADVPTIERLIVRSLAELSTAYYDRRVIQSARGRILGADRRLVAEGTYYVVEIDGRMVGAGGWSGTGRLFGTDHSDIALPEKAEDEEKTAVIRAFYVDPQWTRRGIGRMLLTHCEAEARRNGFRRLVLVALLSGIELFRKMGFAPVGPETLQLPGGLQMDVLHMTKRIAMVSKA